MTKGILVAATILLASGCEPAVIETSLGGSTEVGRLDQEPLRFDVIAEGIDTGSELKIVVLGVTDRPANSTAAPLKVELVPPGEDWDVTPASLDEVPGDEKFARVAEVKRWPCDDGSDCAQTLVVLFQNDATSSVTVQWTIRVRAEVEQDSGGRIVIFPY